MVAQIVEVSHGFGRANDRLVLQGCNDPDAVAGRVATTSPVTLA